MPETGDISLLLQNRGFAMTHPLQETEGDWGTLAQLYAQLTGNSASDAWPKFRAAVTALPGGVTNDDPFGGATGSTHLAHPGREKIARAAC
jgi:hypothetical protein